MNERPIERLNYFNGQRLEAADFRLEQDYHVGIQRWLAKSLFSPGVAAGLEVHPSKDKKKVLVTPGLALDDLGRAIISVNRVELVPQAPFLCVRYLERKVGVGEGSCKVPGPASPETARWGGPTRIYSEPEFIWRRGLPQVDARELVIAELELAPDCSVKKVLSGAKRRAVASSHIAAPYAIVGEKDINQANPKNIYFHVKSYSAQVFLHLRASQFSTLHYTEIPSHSHRLLLDTNDPNKKHIEISEQSDHHHGLTNVKISGHEHKHEITGNFRALIIQPNTGDPNPGSYSNVTAGSVVVDMANSTFGQDSAFVKNKLKLVTETSDSLPVINGSMDEAGKHRHKITIDTSTENTGATGIEVARSGTQLTFPKSLSITFVGDGVTTDITDAILGYLENYGDSSWRAPGLSIGDGTEPHPFVSKGTGAIPLHALVNVGLGENIVKLAVIGPDNGGCIHYNLYIE